MLKLHAEMYVDLDVKDHGNGSWISHTMDNQIILYLFWKSLILNKHTGLCLPGLVVCRRSDFFNFLWSCAFVVSAHEFSYSSALNFVMLNLTGMTLFD
jgi:hypothetical protein